VFSVTGLKNAGELVVNQIPHPIGTRSGVFINNSEKLNFIYLMALAQRYV
jgi:hypothetical protein|tara:strand:+ start:642 stop:791 length:150 start_codon:yes stop_codon:yes gene_type:complete